MMYKSFLKAKRQCDKWGDYKMNIAAFDAQEHMYYEFSACPAADFAKKTWSFGNNAGFVQPGF